MVKKAVNYDAPYVYHLYYGNETGAPGTKIALLASRTGGILIFIAAPGTLSFLISTPESWVPHINAMQWEFPYPCGPGRLFVKDIVSLGAAVVAMSDSAKLYLKRKAISRSF